MLTDRPSNARRIADRPTHAPRRTLLAVHRRYELLVAVLALVLVAILALEAEPASAGTNPGIGAPRFEATPSDLGPGRKPSALRITHARSSPGSVFLGSRREAEFGFELDGAGTRELLVKVVGISSRRVVRRLRLGRVEAGSRHRVSSDGKLNESGYFELWTQPGWYEGGRAKPPTASLERWDGWS